MACIYSMQIEFGSGFVGLGNSIQYHPQDVHALLSILTLNLSISHFSGVIISLHIKISAINTSRRILSTLSSL
jgi:hypothetical protein